MSCVNFPAALRHFTVPLDLAGDRGHLYDVEEIRAIAEMLRKTLTHFVSKENVVSVPGHLSLALEEADPDYFHPAQMTNLVWKRAWQNIGTVDKIFPCGRLMDRDTFVARQACKEGYAYYVCALAEGDGGRPYMAPLNSYSRLVARGLYDYGAVVGDCLYLLTALPNTGCPDIMLCLPLCKHDCSGSAVTEVPMTGRPRNTLHSSLATDGNSMYLFGGYTLKDGSTVASNSLLKLTPKVDLADTKGLLWQELPAGGDRPAERYAHGCWIQQGKLYIFGGLRPNSKGSSQPADIWTLTGDTPPLDTTLDDLWQYDMEKQRWIILEPSGLLPAARAFMGVASNGSIAFVCGGATGFEDVSQKMTLADVWRFDAQTCSWAQAVPCKSQSTWMSARFTHACGVVGGFMCTVGGCISMYRRIRPGEGLCFEMLSDRANVNSPLIKPGFTRDKALEKVSAFMALFRERTSHPPHVQDLLDATKAGACILHIQREDVLDILGSCLMTPHKVSTIPPQCIERIFPGPIRYRSGRFAPFSLSGRDDPWGSENNPFHFTPRHLTGPCEVQVHLEAARSSLSEGILAVTSTIKAFGTVKAAVAYWRSTLVVEGSCDPYWKSLPENMWEEMAEQFELSLLPALEDMEEMVHPLFTRLAWSFGYEVVNDSRIQVFAQTVTDHYYMAHLITHQSSPTVDISSAGVHAFRDALQFLKFQQIAIAEVGHKWPCVCCHCGEAEVLRGKKHTPKMKVCKGCRMVRYCSVECQREAWPQHKEHCKLSS